MDVEALIDIFRERLLNFWHRWKCRSLNWRVTVDAELINTVFRALHTKRGQGAVRYRELAGFTHDLENLFDCMRKGRFCADEDLYGSP
jgi:chemotaxis protein histidine kinase CheA